MPKDSQELQAMQELALEHLSWLHKEAGLPIAELARRMKTSSPLVSTWVNGHRRPSPMSCERIARIFEEEQAKRNSPTQAN